MVHAAATIGEKAMITGIIKTQGLNVRERAARHSERLFSLSAGDQVYILDHGAPYGYEWFKIKVRKTRSGLDIGKEGWAFAADIMPVPPPEAPPPPPEPRIVVQDNSSPVWRRVLYVFAAIVIVLIVIKFALFWH
jgi:hypothetical protein